MDKEISIYLLPASELVGSKYIEITPGGDLTFEEPKIPHREAMRNEKVV